MADGVEMPKELSGKELARPAIDFVRRTTAHHTLLFVDVEHQMGSKKTPDICGCGPFHPHRPQAASMSGSY
jgi:hypothetical protein